MLLLAKVALMPANTELYCSVSVIMKTRRKQVAYVEHGELVKVKSVITNKESIVAMTPATLLLFISTLYCCRRETGTSAYDVIVGYFWSFDVYC